MWGSHHGSESLRHGHNAARYVTNAARYRTNADPKSGQVPYLTNADLKHGQVPYECRFETRPGTCPTNADLKHSQVVPYECRFETRPGTCPTNADWKHCLLGVDHTLIQVMRSRFFFGWLQAFTIPPLLPYPQKPQGECSARKGRLQPKSSAPLSSLIDD